MKPTKEEFKKLQKIWYEKIEKAGFVDIEKKTINKSKAFWKSTAETLQEEYFHVIFRSLQNENVSFRNKIDKYIMYRYADGALIRTIVEELKDLGTPRHRHSIRFIIRRYEMLWGMKMYSPIQLNRKLKNHHHLIQ